MILTKKKMKKIAGIYEKEICAKVPDHEEYNYEFSSEYDDKMRHMIFGAEIKPIKKTAPTVKKAARVAAAAAAVLAMVLGFNTDVRAAVRGWFSHPRADDPKTVVYEFNEDYTDKKLPQITIGWLPEDFEGVEPEDSSTDNRFSRVYEAEGGRVVDITIDYMHTGSTLYLVPEEGEQFNTEKIIINGRYAELYIDSESVMLIAPDDERNIMTQIYATVDPDEAIKIAEAISFTSK